MGSGGSAAKKEKYAARKISDSAATSDVEKVASDSSVQRTGSLQDAGGHARRPSPDTSIDTGGQLRRPSLDDKGIAYHNENCKDSDLYRFTTIRQAYAFENNQKTVEKKERVYGMLDRKQKHWGNTTVTQRGVLQIVCNGCNTKVVDRQGECPFYVCMRCRNAGHKLELCQKCYDQGVDGDRAPSKTSSLRGRAPSKASDQSTPRLNHRASQDGLSSQTGSRTRSSTGEPPRRLSGIDSSPMHDSTRFETAGRRPSVVAGGQAPRRPSAAGAGTDDIPNARWEASVTEEKRTRKEHRDLTFRSDGRVTGSGPEDCKIVGNHTLKAGQGNAMWIETYSWGTLEYSGKFSTVKRVHGTFKTSDGSKGTIDFELK